MKMQLNIQGFSGFKKKMEKHIEGIDKVCKQEAQDCMIDLHKASVPLCPLDTGRLRESSETAVNGEVIATGTADGSVREVMGGHVSTRPGEEVNISTGYSTPYAVIQHENLGFYHPIGQAKYLEAPYNRMIDDILLRLQKSVDKEARK